MTVAGAANYHDFQGLAQLRAQANSTPDEAIEDVAAQFESLFVQMMLKSMRDATIDGGLFNSRQMEVYQGMFDKQLSLGLSGQGGLGLAEILVEELGGSRSALEPRGDTPTTISPAYLRANVEYPTASTIAAAYGAAGAAGADEPHSQAPRTGADGVGWNPESPEEYTRGVWDHAVEAAGKLGLDPLVLVAQSALETGWGKKVVQAVDGRSSFNLFGIKADSGWNGESATVNTLEFREGVAALEKASFRVYESISSSFDDYVSFLENNPRYQQALEKIADSKAFLHELQNAGYATDPRYAEKIMGIVGKLSYGAVIEELKNF